MDYGILVDPLPGSPPDQAAHYQGPWLQTQLTLALTLGISSFLLFAVLRPRYTLLYAPRTKLKGFSPSEAHHEGHSAWGWILPTLRTSERVVLQIVGLDAAVLLGFFKMGFVFFSICTGAALALLVPFNLKVHGSVDSEPDEDPDNSTLSSVVFHTLQAQADFGHKPSGNSTTPPTFLELLTDPTTSLSLHLLFTYAFTLLALYTLWRAYNHFLVSRQLFSLELVHSVSSRTVLVSALPPHLRGERALADYFERLGWGVESVSCVREIGGLAELLDKRTRALLELERTWVEYVGNPATIDSSLFHKSSAPSPSGSSSPVGNINSSTPLLASSLELPGRKRPTIRAGGNRWAVWRPLVDKIGFWEAEYTHWDERVKETRKDGRFRASSAAFVTMESMADAQIAAQVLHSPAPEQCITSQAPEPRDVVWSNVGKSEPNRWARDLVIMGFMTVLLLFWLVPVSGLATLLSYSELSRLFPALTRVLDQSPPLRAFVQNSLPSMALIGFNALLPYVLEFLSYAQGFQARSWVENSLLKKYFLFLLISVVFYWNLTTTYFALIWDLAGTPMKIPEKLAEALSVGPAKHFFLSYVILQGCGIMPFQLLNVGTVVSLGVSRLLWTRTPRDFAELNAPPMLNYGTVYPQALLVFVLTLMYSVVSPMILPFGALYFGVGYLVYKYKLMFVFYKPYESRGQAWTIAFSRMVLGIVLFEIFMTGLFLLKSAYIIATCMAPLILFTVYWSWRMYHRFEPFSTFVSLSLVADVQKGESAENVLRVSFDGEEAEVTRSQANLNRRRYANNQDDLYVAPADDRTDYSQPPMGNYYPGVLNTGKRRYAHPALAGSLPTPWLPLKPGESLLAQASGNPEPSSSTSSGTQTCPRQFSVVLSLGRKVRNFSRDLKDKGKRTPPAEGDEEAAPVQHPLNGAGERARAAHLLGGMRVDVEEDERNPWRESYHDAPPVVSRRDAKRAQRLRHKLSFDPATGVIVLPHSDEDSDNEDDDLSSTNDAPGLIARNSMVRSETTPLLATPESTSTHRPYFPHKRSRTASSPAAPPPTLDLRAKSASAAENAQAGPST